MGSQTYGLSTSRSFGDGSLSRLVVHTPELSQHQIGADDDFLIMASDGVWHAMGSVDAVGIVHRILKSSGDAQQAAETLVRETAVRWEGTGMRDDITVIVVQFGPSQ